MFKGLDSFVFENLAYIIIAIGFALYFLWTPFIKFLDGEHLPIKPEFQRIIKLIEANSHYLYDWDYRSSSCIKVKFSDIELQSGGFCYSYYKFKKLDPVYLNRKEVLILERLVQKFYEEKKKKDEEKSQIVTNEALDHIEKTLLKRAEEEK